MRTIITLIFFAIAAVAQSSRSVVLTWTDTANPVGTAYNVYRAAGPCSGTPAFVKIMTGVVPKTFTDASVAVGNYCYAVTSTFGGMESGYSPTALAPVTPFPPGGLSITVNVTVSATTQVPNAPVLQSAPVQ